MQVFVNKLFPPGRFSRFQACGDCTVDDVQSYHLTSNSLRTRGELCKDQTRNKKMAIMATVTLCVILVVTKKKRKTKKEKEEKNKCSWVC